MIKTGIKWSEYFGSWTGYIFFLTPLIMILLPFVWLCSVGYGIWGLGKLIWDALRGKVHRKTIQEQYFKDVPEL